MPRKAGISYYPSRGAYYTKINGVQYCLAVGPEDGPCGNRPAGPTFKKASAEFDRIINAEFGALPTCDTKVSVIVVRYYAFLNREGRKGTLRVTKSALDAAVRHLGNKTIGELKPLHVSDWLNSMNTWNSTSKHNGVSLLITAFNWAVKEGLIPSHPLKDYKRPEKLVRGKEVLIPEELQQLLIAQAPRAFAAVLRMIKGTGARPGEISHAECKHYDPSIAAIVFPWNPPAGEWRWKNAKKTKRDRVIYLSPPLQHLVEDEIRARGGQGRIFLSPRGTPWNTQSLFDHLNRLLAQPSIREWCQGSGFTPDRVICYSFRHGYITDMLKAGCPIKMLADLCGTSVAMIEKTYSHAADDRQAMRRLFLQYTQQRDTSAAQLPSISECVVQSDPSPSDKNP